MNTIAIDTHQTIKKLLAKGYTQEQAEGFVEAITESQLVTREYLDKSFSDFRTEVYKALLYQTLAVIAAITGILALFF